MIVGIIVAFVIADTPLETLLNTWQVLLGAAATIFAGYLAYQGTQKQIQQIQNSQAARAEGVRIILGIEAKRFSQNLIGLHDSIMSHPFGYQSEYGDREEYYEIPNNLEKALELPVTLQFLPEDIISLPAEIRDRYIKARDSLYDVHTEVVAVQNVPLNPQYLHNGTEILSYKAEEIAKTIKELSNTYRNISDLLNDDIKKSAVG